MNAVVVVESPAKAKTINKYLGKDYQVLASYGHVRDLPAKDGSVRPDEEFAMSWTVDARAEKRLKEIAQAVKGADRLYLATDPDREGEAISWHIAEELKRRRALSGVEVKRVVFNEVTKRAVIEAFQHPRELNGELIDAYLARRALDYLVGFTLSPVLWRKLPGSKSAGRVQSVALRLICEREAEIEVFRPQEYWTIEVALRNAADATFTARLTHLDGRKLEKFDLSDEASASAATRRLEQAAGFQVESVERKETRRNPFPPFTTSTLQQEASRKLGFGATRTMRLAQQLYEGVDLGGETVGLITYMRTDGVQISQEALSSVLPGRGSTSPRPRTPRKPTRRSARPTCGACRAT
jgi:DNA topoisomerase-1